MMIVVGRSVGCDGPTRSCHAECKRRGDWTPGRSDAGIAPGGSAPRRLCLDAIEVTGVRCSPLTGLAITHPSLPPRRGGCLLVGATREAVLTIASQRTKRQIIRSRARREPGRARRSWERRCMAGALLLTLKLRRISHIGRENMIQIIAQNRYLALNGWVTIVGRVFSCALARRDQPAQVLSRHCATTRTMPGRRRWREGGSGWVEAGIGPNRVRDTVEVL
jgi:hypothetical protein